MLMQSLLHEKKPPQPQTTTDYQKLVKGFEDAKQKMHFSNIQ